tara:strand:+ start:293 stop:880 length:588 start_codon:yes stop_codon:yes gene_type:complete
MLKFKKIKGNLIHKTAVINWKDLKIGKGNIIGPYVVIGNKGQWKNKRKSGKIIIGNKNIINEYTNIHLPTNLKKITYIGNNNYIMNSSTIDHDCYIEDNITMSSNVVLGGNVHIMKYSNLGIRTIVHQNQVIGSYCMIGMGSIITKNKKIKPGFVFYGKPIKLIRKNIHILQNNKISSKMLAKEKIRFNKILKTI